MPSLHAFSSVGWVWDSCTCNLVSWWWTEVGNRWTTYYFYRTHLPRWAPAPARERQREREKKAWAFCLCLCLAHTRQASSLPWKCIYQPCWGGYTLDCGSFVGQLSVHRDTFKRGIPCRCRQAGGGTKPLGRPYLIGKKSKSLDRKK